MDPMDNGNEIPGGATAEAGAVQDAGGSVTLPEDFETWLDGQAEEVKALVSGLHEKKVAGLRSALQAERDERKSERQKYQAQLSEAVAKATGAEKAALEALQSDIAAAGARADFYADAHEAGVVDLRTAWAAIKEYDLHDRKGQPDLEALKVRCPYLFVQPAKPAAPRVGAGVGTQQPPAPAAEDPLRAAFARLRG